MPVTVVGIFDRADSAEEARAALLALGVLEARITLDRRQSGECALHVRAESSLERERIRDVLRRHGASFTEQHRAAT